MKPMDFRDRWVMVTGASSGLGLEMVRALTRSHGANVVAIARRADKLEELRREIEDGSRSRVVPVVADLSKVEEVDRAFEEATRQRDLYAAVLNAGVTHFGHWNELSWDGFENMLSLNVRSVVRMTGHVVPHIQQASPGGGVMLVSSMAGLAPVPFQTAYSATKAFLVHYGAGLHHELAPTGVSVTVFAPGGIVTEMTAGETFDKLRTWLMPADRCAENAVNALRKRAFLEVPGLTYKALSLLSRLGPRKLVAGATVREYRASLDAARKGQGSR